MTILSFVNLTILQKSDTKLLKLNNKNQKETMKYFIKLCILGLLLSIDSGVYAQRFGIKAGMNFSDVRQSPKRMINYLEKIETKYGFHAGATAEFPIAGVFSFETGILISSKGYKGTRHENHGNWHVFNIEKAKTIYLEIPLTAKASADLGKASIYGVFGPYLAWGIGGSFKSKTSGPWEPWLDEQAIKWGNNRETDDFNNLDFGLTMGAGVEIHPIQIGISYGLGLANILPFTRKGDSLHNRVLGISVGYKFDKK